MVIKTVNDLIDEFGGTLATSQIFGVLPSAVSNWRKADAFPARLHLRVSKYAMSRDIKFIDAVFEV